MNVSEFAAQFNFQPAGAGLVGIERECFTTDLSGVIKPLTPSILPSLDNNGQFGYELSACQLEDRIGPCTIESVGKALQTNDEILSEAEARCSFRRLYLEVVSADMPLDVYPDPTGRYQRITANMPREILVAACRVAGTHVHIGMPDLVTAMRVYHQAIPHLDELIRMGDGSNGERMRIYQVMAPDRTPKVYPNGWTEFHDYAIKMGFESNPRSCWHLIRISIHGTIEFRMFGSTPSNSRIEEWAQRCHEICRF